MLPAGAGAAMGTLRQFICALACAAYCDKTVVICHATSPRPGQGRPTITAYTEVCSNRCPPPDSKDSS